MAMNKAEQLAFSLLKTELAFRWPTEAEPDRTVLPPSGGGKVTGWNFNAHTGEVEEYWTCAVSHGRFYQGKEMTGSQGGRSLYATRREALVAMRWEMCWQMAGKLRAVDAMIEKAAA